MGAVFHHLPIRGVWKTRLLGRNSSGSMPAAVGWRRGSPWEEVAGAAPEREIGMLITNTGLGRGDGQGESSVEEEVTSFNQESG